MNSANTAVEFDDILNINGGQNNQFNGNGQLNKFFFNNSLFQPNNYRVITISGANTTCYLSSLFTPFPYSTFNLLSSTLIGSTLNINNGNFYVDGTITASLLNISSNTGLIRINSLNSLNINGNLLLSSSATLIIQIGGLTQFNALNINGSVTMNCLLYIKLLNMVLHQLLEIPFHL